MAPDPRPVHGRILRVARRALDWEDRDWIDERFERFLDGVPRPSRIVVDLRDVDFIGEAMPLLRVTLAPDRFGADGHLLLCTRLGRQPEEVFSLFGLWETGALARLPDGHCPICEEPGLDAETSACSRCGPFEVVVLAERTADPSSGESVE